MPRIRTIKPGFFTSEDVAELSHRARLTWIGLWTYVDDAGRAKDNVRLIKAAIWSLDDDVQFREIKDDLTELADKGRIHRYEVDGKPYLQVTNWVAHQRIQKPSTSAIPGPGERSATPPSRATSGGNTPPSTHSPNGNTPTDLLSERSGSGSSPQDTHRNSATGGKGKEREGKGEGREGDARETRQRGRTATAPPPRCPRHITEPAPGPCTACADRRRDHDQWLREQRDQPTHTGAPAPDDPRCDKPGHEHEIAGHCRLCRSEALAPIEPDPEGSTP